VSLLLYALEPFPLENLWEIAFWVCSSQANPSTAARSIPYFAPRPLRGRLCHRDCGAGPSPIAGQPTPRKKLDPAGAWRSRGSGLVAAGVTEGKEAAAAWCATRPKGKPAGSGWHTSSPSGFRSSVEDIPEFVLVEVDGVEGHPPGAVRHSNHCKAFTGARSCARAAVLTHDEPDAFASPGGCGALDDVSC